MEGGLGLIFLHLGPGNREITNFSSFFMGSMDPRSKGWLGEYLQFRQGLFQDITSEGHKSAHPDFSLYRIMQPTGLMYGQPVTPFEHADSASWTVKDRLKILLAESLISSSLLFHEQPVKTPEEISALLMKTVDSINTFYKQVFPEMAASSTTLFGRKKTSLELAEQILERRVDHIEVKGNFWVHFFHNSLLFLDIFIYGQWIHTNADKIVSDFFSYERDELRTSLVKVMAVASHANHTVEFEERRLLEFFLQSTKLSNERKNECRAIFEKGILVEELDLPTSNSWILKKYFLEIAILTFWADKRVQEAELELLNRLASSMSFSGEDVENSLLAVEGFILEHWKELEHLSDNKSYEEVSRQFIDRMAGITTKHKTKLLHDVRSWSELVNLLTRARSVELNVEEKNELRRMLVEVLKKIPTFVIIALPHQFLTLPILMQVLPKNFIVESLEV